MYRVMLADDEGIVLDSLKMIIEKHFPGQCQLETAKTGRDVIELAESFRPDLAFMDIQMPGINGIDAIREIKKSSPSVEFIILSAYDKFDYAKEAINLGVLEYVNKPFSAKSIAEVLEKALKTIDSRRKKRSDDLRIRRRWRRLRRLLKMDLSMPSCSRRSPWRMWRIINSCWGLRRIMAVCWLWRWATTSTGTV